MKTKLSLQQLLKSARTYGSHVPTAIIFMILLALSPSPCALSQIPQGFNYQAIARDAGGNLITTAFDIKVEIQNLAADTVFWIEEHTVTPNEYGLISFVVGQSGRTGGTALLFEDIDWASHPRYLKTSANTGSGYTVMGIAQIMSVPYSLVAKEVTGPVENLNIAGTTEDMDEALFEVRNKDGQVIFAVYNEGVRIYVDDTAKGPKGGFAIGSFGTTKEGESQPYFIVKPDTVRIYINQTGKGPKGGFAIGGYGIDKTEPQNFLFVSDDSVRVYIDNADDDYPKGVKGGFAIGGYGLTKGGQKLMTVSDDSVRIYINDGAKGPKGGFAIGGFDKTKGEGNNANFFNVSTNAQDTIDPSQNRILWYPVKNAFLTGKVLVELPDSVGENSFASGYESKAVGDYAQALGYQTVARGNNSTSIGYRALADKINSFAFGNYTKATGTDAIALGSGANASGAYSFALGAIGVDTAGNPAGSTSAIGEYSFAIGQGATSSSKGAFSIGTKSISGGNFSTALGYKAQTNGYYALALGANSEATGSSAMAMGNYTTATGDYAIAVGGYATSSYSISIGRGSASQVGSVVLGGALICFAQPFPNPPICAYKSTSSAGIGAFAIGHGIKATGNYSFAIGQGGFGHTTPPGGTESIGYSSYAIGNYVKSSGSYSTAIGNSTNAYSGYETVIGRFNTSYTPSSTTGWNSNDRLFVVGNGTSTSDLSDALTIFKNGNTLVSDNLGIGAPGFGGGTKVFAIENGTVPTSSTYTSILLYAENVLHSTLGYWSELKVRDGFGYVTTLSPHNFNLTEISEPMAWSFYSENHSIGQKINVDMLKAVRLIEQLSGEKLVYIEDFEGNAVDYSSVKYPKKKARCNKYTEDVLESLKKQEQKIESQQQQIEELKAMVEKLMVK